MPQENIGNYNWFQGSAIAGTASSRIKSGVSVVMGVIVGSNSTGSYKLSDGLTAGGSVIVGSYTPAAGSSIQAFPVPLKFGTGVYIQHSEIAGGAKMENVSVITD